jgi:tetratricopeptide (TPR) repeat protein
MSITSAQNNAGDAGASGRALCAVTCPMCGHDHKQVRLNPRLFWNQSLALDRQPTQYQCLKGLENIHPPLYELWHCPKCQYTANHRIFLDPLKNVYIEKGVVARKLDEARRDPAFVQICTTLGEGVGQERISFTDAIRMAYLAVFFGRFLVGLLRQGNAGLAREFLRLGWFYRDWFAMTNAEERAGDYAALQAQLEGLRSCWPEIPMGEADALHEACKAFENSLDEAAIAGDVFEKASILQHSGCIFLQVGDYDEAISFLQQSRQGALDEESNLKRLLQEDDRTKRLSADDRSKYVSLARRLRQLIEESQDLIETAKKMKQPAVAAAVKSEPAAAPAKKGFLKGLFSG